jgi:hypothetical protein
VCACVRESVCMGMRMGEGEGRCLAAENMLMHCDPSCCSPQSILHEMLQFTSIFIGSLRSAKRPCVQI